MHGVGNKYIWSLLGAQTTPASSKWPQFSIPRPLWSHCVMLFSVPSHSTLSYQILPEPGPKKAFPGALTA